MVKTAEQVVNDIFLRIKDSDFAKSLSGVICFEGQRPLDSQEEDAVIIFTSGGAEQVQEGIVTLNIYVPDKPANGGIFRKDTSRCREVSSKANEWVVSLIEESADYLFELNGIIDTNSVPEINQHFVIVKLNYRLLTT